MSGSGGDLLLMTPGPSRVPERVLRAGALPMIHHRAAEFSAVLADVLAKMRPLFGTVGEVLPIHATGRGAMEAAIANLFSAGDEIVCCCNGKFGEMWARLAVDYGLVVHRVATDWGRDIDAAEVAAALAANPAARAVTAVHGDTSTGVLNDIAAVAGVTRARGVLCIVDAISVLGGVPFQFDAWGVDVAVTASQKCLMSSAGLAFVAVSERVWSACERATLPRSYWDFRSVRASLAKSGPETPASAPVHLFRQVAEALALIHEEGLASVFSRHEANAQAARAGVADLGLAVLRPTTGRLAPILTPVVAPEGIAPDEIRRRLVARGILVAGGLERYADRVFRIGHLGDIRVADVNRTLRELAAVLEGIGVPAGEREAGA